MRGSKMSVLEREMATYRAHLPELLQHAGKYVFIRGDRVVEVFDTYADALRAAYAQAKPGEFMIKRIVPAEHVAFFTRDLAM